MQPPSLLGTILTTDELAAATAGGYDYIRTKNNVVCGLALVPEFNHHAPKNPNEPGVITFGAGPKRIARAKLFAESKIAVPTYIKRGVDRWEYFGNYHAVDIKYDAKTIKDYDWARPARIPAGEIAAGVLFIEAASSPEIQISGGGFGDPEKRKKVEKAAIDFVTARLIERGFDVHDRQRDNVGYDLLAVKDSGNLFVEVKGTASFQPRFFLSRNESRCSSQHQEWRLFVVSGCDTAPRLHEFTASEMRQKFTFDPLAWECVENKV